jgi:DnaJ-class molecular chaperone
MKLRPICTTCKGRKLLWLGGKDYVECPDCEGTGSILMYEEKKPPPPTRVFMPGVKSP